MKKTKKYQLVNSYFKVARIYGLPQTILEIAEYLNENGELPFAYSGSNWVYDAMCECQKREGVYNSQFLTPDATVERLMHFAGKYFTDNNVLEPCCGTGQITKELLKCGYNVAAFDNDKSMCEICDMVCLQTGYTINYHIEAVFFQQLDHLEHQNQIIANPPYEIPKLTDFLEWIDNVQDCGGISILLLPKGFINKDKPKRTFQVLRKFSVLETEDMREPFARTVVSAEIVVLKKL